MDRFRAHSLFQPTNFVAAIENRHDGEGPEHLFGAVLAIPHTQAARIVAVLGFDFVFVDTLHAATNAETLVAIIQTINFASEGKTCTLVRVSGPESDLVKTIQLMNHRGAAGIIFPQVDTATEASAAVAKVRYAYAGGNRSLSPLALLDGITNTAPPGWTAETIADRNIAVICQIESVLGVENAQSIAETPGVNALMLGAGDLRASLGLPLRNPPGQGEHPLFYEAVDKLVAASKKSGIPVMVPAFRTNPDTIDWLRNFKLILTSVDILNLVKAHRQDLAVMKQSLLGYENSPQNGQKNGQKNGHQNGHQNGCHNGLVDKTLCLPEHVEFCGNGGHDMPE
ncbi:hypothetical protein HIM_03034 [Hirsutella minnesotensis 3608]|nr:hypothetical protein HIM_03034 [Hirsutella minnesotensis 3608]